MRRICAHCQRGYLRRTGYSYTWRDFLGGAIGVVYERACGLCGRKATHRVRTELVKGVRGVRALRVGALRVNPV